ncbi:Abi family protein [Fructobacillus tropaeoli]|uniref:Abortive infection bacteriophage resistance protein (AbiF) n=1 Tax=Fructobacillus tropaeoli TaxID=709323 RepID=A0ABN9YNH6_9LACO|nr:Abortive infection bacteriophage resistance protein (AbiF) [Fructobacillus tropaeoli]CAK1235490.1 Abortive infection bacteriophage resistance protein (AbiF) [Fructobacillus tropaeoli]
MENELFFGKINPKKIKHKRSIELEVQSESQKSAMIFLEIIREKFPVKIENQKGNVKNAVSIDKMVDHLKEKVVLQKGEEERFYALIREKMYYKVSYFVKLLYNVNGNPITFTDLENIFYFDDFLRTSLSRLLPSIEQFVKSSLNNCLLEKYDNDSLIYLNEKLYKHNTESNKSKLNDVLSVCASEISEVSNSNDAVKHHIINHGGNIPLWILFDTITFGKFNMLVTCMDRKVRRYWIDYMKLNCQYSDDFEMSAKSLPSHLQTVQILRNSASHLSRIYGKVFTYNPGIRPSDKYWNKISIESFNKPDPSVQIHSLFSGLISAKYFYQCMSNTEVNKWNKFIEKLDNKMTEIKYLNSNGYMGFPENWKAMLLIV